MQTSTITLKVGDSQVILSADGIRLKANKIILRNQVNSTLLPIACQSDLHSCPAVSNKMPHQGGPILQGMNKVLINNKAIATKGGSVQCQGEQATITTGATNISCAGKPLAHQGAKTSHGGEIKSGSADVVISTD